MSLTNSRFNELIRLHKGMASLPYFVLLFLLVTIAQILAVEAGTPVDQAHLPCLPSCLGDLRLLLVLLLMRIFVN